MNPLILTGLTLSTILASAPTITAGTPLTWQQIETKQNLVLNETIKLSETLTLPLGTKATVYDILILDDINVIDYQMNITPCTPELKNEISDMILVNDIYGTKLEKDCKLGVFLEAGDYSKESFFSALEPTSTARK